MAKFPKTLAVINRQQGSQWELGDAILEECGPPSSHGVHNGSYEPIKELWEEIRAECIDEYTISYLSELRVISFNFPRPYRQGLVSWSVHHLARNCETLDWLLEQAQGRKLTKSLAKKLLKPEEPDRPQTEPAPISYRDALATISSARKFFAQFEDSPPAMTELGQAEADVVFEQALSLMRELGSFCSKYNSKRSHLKVV